MKVYITKYALTKGIETAEVDFTNDDDDDVKYVYTRGRYHQQFVMDRDAFLTYAEAAVAARAMRDRKAISLRKQLNKVTGLLFPTMEPENLK